MKLLVFSLIIILSIWWSCPESARSSDPFLLASSQENNGLQSRLNIQPPPWPLEKLDYKERLSRINMFIQEGNFSPTDNHNVGIEHCKSLLQKIKEKSFKVLDPDFISYGRKDERAYKIINACNSIEIDRVRFDLKKGALSEGVDPAFDKLSLEEKDIKSDYYFKYNDTIEFYNLSNFFDGKEIWGTFSDHGIILYKNIAAHLFEKFEGYKLYANVVVGPVFDINSCKTYLPPKVKGGSRLHKISDKPNSFFEKLDFYAFIEINKEIYRISSQTLKNWSNSSSLFGDETYSTIFLDSASNSNSLSCTYESTPHSIQ